jgi:hypothetical protein
MTTAADHVPPADPAEHQTTLNRGQSSERSPSIEDDLLMREADHLFEDDRLEQAAFMYESARIRFPYSPQLLSRLVQVNLRLGRHDCAQTHLETLREHVPEYPLLAVLEGDLALAQCDLDAATFSYRQAIGINMDRQSVKTRIKNTIVESLRQQQRRQLEYRDAYETRLIAAIRAFFPYDLYRSRHPEAAALSDQELLEDLLRSIASGAAGGPRQLGTALPAAPHPSAEADKWINALALFETFPVELLVKVCPDLAPILDSFAERENVEQAHSTEAVVNLVTLLLSLLGEQSRLMQAQHRIEEELRRAQEDMARLRCLLIDQA